MITPSRTGVVALSILLAAMIPAPTSSLARAAAVKCAGERATIVGTKGRDVIIGTPERDVIVALKGRDRIVGKGGDDLVCAGKGADRIYGNAGDDVLYGEENRRDFDEQFPGDHIRGGRGDDTMDGGDGPGVDHLHYEHARSAIHVNTTTRTVTGTRSGHDTITGFAAIYGTAFDDVMTDGGFESYFHGGPGNDLLELGGGYNYGYGDDGDDHLTAGYSQANNLFGGNGADVLEIVGGDGHSRLRGEEGDDTLIGGIGRDDLYGGPGNDVLRPGDGRNYFVLGEDGDDTLIGGSDSDDLDGGAGTDYGDGGLGVDTCVNIEEEVSCESRPLRDLG